MPPIDFGEIMRSLVVGGILVGLLLGVGVYYACDTWTVDVEVQRSPN